MTHAMYHEYGVTPYRHRGRRLRGVRISRHWEVRSRLVLAVDFACWLLWWLARGSAYGIGLCLQGQLRVPVEGWRIIGRHLRNPPSSANGYYALLAVEFAMVVWIAVRLMLRILL